MNTEQHAKHAKRILHEAHLRFQRSKLKAEAIGIPCGEIRGVRVRSMLIQTFKPEWFTHLRPNFWRSYVETVLYMSR